MLDQNDSTEPMTSEQEKQSRVREREEQKRKKALNLPENALDDFWKRQ